MEKLEQFSVYNALLAKEEQQIHENTLKFLVPHDNEHGWHVSRNLLKPLNHLDFLKRKAC